MIHQVIAAYLRTNKRLVIPQFGALIHKESEGTIAFVPFLKKDDGVLTQQVAAAYGIDLGEASAKIEAWVNEIKTQITTVGAYPLEGIGILRLDPNGIYSLMDSVSSSFSTPKGEAVRPQGTPSPSAPPAPSRTISTLDPATQAHSGASPRPYAGQRPVEASNGTLPRPTSPHTPEASSATGTPQHATPPTRPMHPSSSEPHLASRPAPTTSTSGRAEGEMPRKAHPIFNAPAPSAPQNSMRPHPATPPTGTPQAAPSPLSKRRPEAPTAYSQKPPVQQPAPQPARSQPGMPQPNFQAQHQPGIPPMGQGQGQGQGRPPRPGNFPPQGRAPQGMNQPPRSMPRQRRPMAPPVKRSRHDGFMVIAILAAAAALAVMIFGFLVNQDAGPDLRSLLPGGASADTVTTAPAAAPAAESK